MMMWKIWEKEKKRKILASFTCPAKTKAWDLILSLNRGADCTSLSADGEKIFPCQTRGHLQKQKRMEFTEVGTSYDFSLCSLKAPCRNSAYQSLSKVISHLDKISFLS